MKLQNDQLQNLEQIEKYEVSILNVCSKYDNILVSLQCRGLAKTDEEGKPLEDILKELEKELDDAKKLKCKTADDLWDVKFEINQLLGESESQIEKHLFCKAMTM